MLDQERSRGYAVDEYRSSPCPGTMQPQEHRIGVHPALTGRMLLCATPIYGLHTEAMLLGCAQLSGMFVAYRSDLC